MPKVGFAIQGTGLIASIHAKVLATIPQARLIAVCSRSAARGGQFASEFNCANYTDPKQMLCLPEVDVLLIATPSGTHQAAAILAAQYGKHVLCEKPLEITSARIDAMIAAHRAAGTL